MAVGPGDGNSRRMTSVRALQGNFSSVKIRYDTYGDVSAETTPIEILTHDWIDREDQTTGTKVVCGRGEDGNCSLTEEAGKVVRREENQTEEGSQVNAKAGKDALSDGKTLQSAGKDRPGVHLALFCHSYLPNLDYATSTLI